MASNRLNLNADKMQVIWIGPHQQLAKVNITELQLMSATVKFSDTVFDLGVVVDRELTMSNQVAVLSHSCFYQLHQLRAVRNSLDIEATKTLVNAFVASPLDYCNSLLAGITDGLLSKHQLIQNTAARLITWTRSLTTSCRSCVTFTGCR